MKPGFDPIKKRHSNSRRQIPHPNPNRCCSWGISFRGRRMVYITKTTPSRQTAINPVSLKFKFKLIDSVSCYLVFSLPSSTHSGNKVVRSISLSFSHSSRQVSIAIHSYWVVTGFVIKEINVGHERVNEPPRGLPAARPRPWMEGGKLTKTLKLIFICIIIWKATRCGSGSRQGCICEIELSYP